MNEEYDSTINQEGELNDDIDDVDVEEIIPEEIEPSVGYCDDGVLYQEFLKWREKDIDGEKIPDSIAQAILDICNNLARRPNFSGYTWKDEMIGDAIIDCLKACKSFNYVKYNKPFAYLTTIAWKAFVRRITSENKQKIIVAKYIVQTGVLNQDDDTPKAIKDAREEFVSVYLEKDEENQKKKAERLAKQNKKNPLEELIDG